MPFDTPKSFLLGPWKIEPLKGSMTGPNGESEHLEPKVMDVLVCLSLHANDVVARERLLDAVWGGSVAADEQLTRAISELRRVFHDDPRDPDYIATVPKRGYRLIKEVRAIDFENIDKNDARADILKRHNSRNAGLLGVGLLALFVIYAVSGNFGLDSGQDEQVPSEKSIAVLPFVNMSEEPGNDYFSDGLSEDIINLLSDVPGLKVIGRTSSFSFKGKNEDLRIIGEQLGVNTLLEGSVRKSGDNLRIVAQLIDASNGAHIWSETYDRTLTDIFAVQDDIAASVVDALKIHVAPTLHRDAPTENLEAYRTFLKARLAINRLEWREASELLESVVLLDSQFAEAYELLAYSYWYAASNGLDPDYAQEKTREAASVAVALDPGLVFAQRLQRSIAGSGLSYLPNFEASESAYSMQPRNPMVLDSLVYLYTYGGYKDDAVRIARQYVDVDPLSLDANLDLFGALYSAGKIEEAMQVLEIINEIGLGPSNWQWTIAGAKIAEGDDESAIEYFEDLLRLYDHRDIDWVRELVVAARDPKSGQKYLDRRIPEIAATLPEEDNFNWRSGLVNWYLYFGFIDRYFEMILEPDPWDGTWSDAEEQLWHGHAFHRLGFTSHPAYIQFAADRGILEVWEMRGPPDFCEKKDESWACM